MLSVVGFTRLGSQFGIGSVHGLTLLHRMEWKSLGSISALTELSLGDQLEYRQAQFKV